MKHWNYRVVKREGLLAIHSVYYDENDQISGIGETPEPAVSEDLESLRTQLTLMLEATGKNVIVE